MKNKFDKYEGILIQWRIHFRNLNYSEPNWEHLNLRDIEYVYKLIISDKELSI